VSPHGASGKPGKLRDVHDVHPPVLAVRETVDRALREDLTPLGDISSALLPADLEATAAIVPRADGVVAGCLCADEAFRQIDPTLRVRWQFDDGDRAAAGQPIAHVTGALVAILTAERTALNFLGHLSGVATLTARFVAAVASAGANMQVLDTRKTTPGLRALEKAAVRAGGGSNHRGNLSDWVLLKDNHVAWVPIGEAATAARRRWPGRTVQVECSDAAMVRQAMRADVDAVLLDNMTPEAVVAVVKEVRAQHPTRPSVEISGGIDTETIASYVSTGADAVSVGALTHSAPVLDIGLDVDAG
jgi:nicotinate-nucleotide pyrophosphorylase (carboxylating)